MFVSQAVLVKSQSALILAHVTLIALRVAKIASILSVNNVLMLKKMRISRNVRRVLMQLSKNAWQTVLVMHLASLLVLMFTPKT